MLSIRSNVITLTRGDNADFDITIVTAKKQPYEMVEGDALQFSLKKTTKKNSPLLLQKTFSQPNFSIVPEDTKDLEFGSYVYDIEIHLATGQIYTIIPDTAFIIAEEVG